ncbi:MAG TPA: hypothetical protein VIA62_11865 [Thermoanaerobaculia bacterium]|jgi:hypothetical protein|nr:hypothetical protein [Thermoanaerobaculia bacterium]
MATTWSVLTHLFFLKTALRATSTAQPTGTTDAVCYHDGHRSLDEHLAGPIFEVPIFGDDGALRDEHTIRTKGASRFAFGAFWRSGWHPVRRPPTPHFRA